MNSEEARKERVHAKPHKKASMFGSLYSTPAATTTAPTAKNDASITSNTHKTDQTQHQSNNHSAASAVDNTSTAVTAESETETEAAPPSTQSVVRTSRELRGIIKDVVLLGAPLNLKV